MKHLNDYKTHNVIMEKNNNKEDRLSFVKEVKKLIEEFGGEKTKQKSGDVSMYKIKIEKNTLNITVQNEDSHKYSYVVFMRFDPPLENLGNKHSGKYNFFSSVSLEESVKDFKSFLEEAIEKMK